MPDAPSISSADLDPPSLLSTVCTPQSTNKPFEQASYHLRITFCNATYQFSPQLPPEDAPGPACLSSPAQLLFCIHCPRQTPFWPQDLCTGWSHSLHIFFSFLFHHDWLLFILISTYMATWPPRGGHYNIPPKELNELGP